VARGGCVPVSGQVTAKDAVLDFISAINAHDVTRILALCTEDHEFIDAYGGVVAGDGLLPAWQGYFAFMPEYGIDVEDITGDGHRLAVFGSAWGRLAPAHGGGSWRRPAAWRARVNGGRVRLWQVYVDTKIVFDAMAPR
jgi:ketosteroid isomerase-like protein